MLLMVRAWLHLRRQTLLTPKYRRVSPTNRFLRLSRMGRRARSCHPGGTNCRSRTSRLWLRIFARSALRINLGRRPRRRQRKVQSQKCTRQVTICFSAYPRDDASIATASTSTLLIALSSHRLSRDPRWVALCPGSTIFLFPRSASATALPTSCPSVSIVPPLLLP